MPAAAANVKAGSPRQSKVRAGKVRQPAVGQLMPDAPEWGVRECLDWRTQSAKRTLPTHLTSYLLPKPELGRAQPLGFGIPEDFVVTDKPVDSNGTAIEAIRGWPSLHTSPAPLLDQYRLQMALEEDARKEEEKSRRRRQQQQQQQKRRGGKKDNQRLTIKLDESAEHCMPDVMSHRFLYENLIREAEERRARAGYVADTTDPDPVKMNRASQLRASHVQGQKVKVTSRDKHASWHMRQFGDGATSQLDTFRTS